MVHAIKQNSWLNSKIPVIDDKKIAEKVKKDFEELTSLKISKSRNSDLEVHKRKQFSDRMETILDKSHPNTYIYLGQKDLGLRKLRMRTYSSGSYT